LRPRALSYAPGTGITAAASSAAGASIALPLRELVMSDARDVERST
jgi:hypothetical protein